MLTVCLTALLASVVPQAPKPTPQDTAFAADQARVSLELFRKLGDDGNLICSPFSIARALAMAREGAAGETASELERALRLPSDGAGAFGSLSQALAPFEIGQDDKRHALYELELATSFWGQKGKPFEADFLARLKRGFATELFPTDFRATEEARVLINEWTAKQTNGLIPEIVPAGVLSADTRLVLVDAIHFKASWAEPFQVGATKPAPFELGGGAKAEVPTMHRTDEFGYGETELARVLELPYERGATSMVIVLPKAVDGLAQVVAREDVAQWTAVLAERRVAVALPKFRFAWGKEVTPCLAALGIRAAFDPAHADFSRILHEQLFIGVVMHRAFVAVDEAGTEAAAATAVMMRGTKANMNEPLEFRADHPFLFLIRHRATGAVLFVGRVSDPTKG